MKRKSLVGFITLLSSLCLFFISSLFAQNLQGGLAPILPSASAASYYYIAKPGELTMQVNLWGFVKNPGRYEVPSSTDLVQLISFAGGPVEYAKMDEVKITHAVRSDSATSNRTIVVDLENLDRVKGEMLKLYPGDTIFIDHTGWLTLRDAFNVITVAAVITTAVAQVIWVSRK
jgi:protein involved in polysaccharide export with SLBB domain